MSFGNVAKGIQSGLATIAHGTKAAFDTAVQSVKTIVSVTSAATAAVSAFAKSAYNDYSEYQQLVGGVDTLFKQHSAKLQEYAASAYKSAGMSANAYMDSAVKFSASLLQGLNNDTAAAADFANLAIQDMSDNVNKFGSDISSVETAYQGFAKQNYTLLDNLRLGYGGTASEMARLINDTKVFYKTVDEKSVKEVPFHTIIQAIHTMQAEMDIAGTTAAEAAETISGSTASMAAAWENLQTEISKPDGNIADRFRDFADAALTAKNNIVPTIKDTFQGVRDLIKTALPTVMEEIPKLITEVLPTAIYTGTSLIRGLGTTAKTFIPALAKAIEGEAYASSKAFGGAILAIGTAIGKELPTLANTLKKTFKGLFDGINIKETVGVITDAIKYTPELVSMVTSAIPALLTEVGNALSDSGTIGILTQSITQIFGSLLDLAINTAPILIPAGAEVLRQLLLGFTEYLPTMMPQIGELMWLLAETFTRPDVLQPVIEASAEFLKAFIQGFVDIAPIAAKSAPTVVKQLMDVLSTEAPMLVETGFQMAGAVIQGLTDYGHELFMSGVQVVIEIISGIGSYFSNMWETAKDLLGEFLDGLTPTGTDISNVVTDIYQSLSSKITELMPWARGWGMDLVDNFVGGIEDNLHKVVSASSGLAGIIHDYLHFSQPDKGPLADFGTYAPDMVDLFVKGIDSNQSSLIASVSGMAENIRGSLNFDVPMLSPVLAGTGLGAAATALTASTPIVININNSFDISGVTNVNDLDFDDLSGKATEQLADKLEQLGIGNNRAVGSPGWV